MEFVGLFKDGKNEHYMTININLEEQNEYRTWSIIGTTSYEVNFKGDTCTINGLCYELFFINRENFLIIGRECNSWWHTIFPCLFNKKYFVLEKYVK